MKCYLIYTLGCCCSKVEWQVWFNMKHDSICCFRYFNLLWLWQKYDWLTNSFISWCNCKLVNSAILSTILCMFAALWIVKVHPFNGHFHYILSNYIWSNLDKFSMVISGILPVHFNSLVFSQVARSQQFQKQNHYIWYDWFDLICIVKF